MVLKLKMNKEEISGRIRSYLGSRDGNARYTSFDYCYNHFRGFVDSDSIDEIASAENLQTSCLQLGFYLASWGMYRGSSQLLQHSSHSLVPVIQAIASTEEMMWNIDVDSYDESSYTKISNSMERISEAFPHNASLTLVSKTILGVFGCVPAFDSYFVKNSGLRRINNESLMKLRTFYERNQQTIEEIRQSTYTIDFKNGQPTKHLYTRAKMIDMVFFVNN